MNKALSPELTRPLLQQLLFAEQELDLDLLATVQTLLSEMNERPLARFAHMTADLAPFSLLGMQLAAHHQGNLLSPELYPALAQAEQDCLDWLKNLLSFPYAHFSHGGSYNNLEALWQAREHSENSSHVVYTSAANHYSLSKACQLLGLHLHALPVNGHDQLDIDALTHACQQQAPMAIVLNLGTTGTGSIDDIEAASHIAQQYQAWVHVDAAWGGAILSLPEHALKADFKIDSLSFDPHKSWFQPRPCSVLFSRHDFGQEHHADYLNEKPLRQLSGSYGGELFLPLWLNWQQLGADWFEQKTRFRLAQAALLNDFFEAESVTTHHAGTGIVCFESGFFRLDDLVTKGLLSRYQTVNGQPYYRAVFNSHQHGANPLIQTIQSAL